VSSNHLVDTKSQYLLWK